MHKIELFLQKRYATQTEVKETFGISINTFKKYVIQRGIKINKRDHRLFDTKSTAHVLMDAGYPKLRKQQLKSLPQTTINH